MTPTKMDFKLPPISVLSTVNISRYWHPLTNYIFICLLARMRALATLFLLLPYVIGGSASQIPLAAEPSSGTVTTTLNSERQTPPTEVQDGQTGTLIVMPPVQTYTGTKIIPGIISSCFSISNFLIPLSS